MEFNSLNLSTDKFSIIFEDITYSIELKDKSNRKFTKTIIDKVTGYANSHELTAIMGPSGSGKTSLLNFLTNRINFTSNCKHDGRLFINSKEKPFSYMEDVSSYVMQDDMLFHILTVKETFLFVSRLRRKATAAEHETEINKLIDELKLKNCENTRIGNETIKGISGGERKRVSIGIEIMSNPSILFLDEPTSGLDSQTSYIVIDFLREIAESKKIAVVFTIHQPSSNIMSLINRVVMLNKGRLTYQGPTMTKTEEVFSYLSALHPPVGQLANPADYFMHALEERNAFYEKNPDGKDLISDNYFRLKHALIEEDINNIKKENRKCELRTKQLGNVAFCDQFGVLCKRTYLNVIRNPTALRTRIFMLLVFSFIACSIFYNMSYDIAGTYNRMGFLFFFTINNFMTLLFSAVLAFPLERGIFLREYANKLYGIVPYYLSKNLIETPIGLLSTFIYGVIVYYIVGLRPEVQYFFIFLCNFVVLGWLSISMGLFFGASFSSLQTALIITQFSVLPAFLFSGFLINQANMPVWLAWIRFISPFRYSLEASMRNEFENNPRYMFNPVEQLNLDIGMWNCVIIMVFMGIGLRILGLIFLKIASNRKTG